MSRSTKLSKPQSENKKVRNATITIVDGKRFRSKLESYVYKSLKEAKITFEHEPIKFILIPGFEFQGQKIRPITLTPDFVGDNFIMDAKGHPNDVFPYKWKLLQKHLLDNGLEDKYKLFVVHNQKETKAAINQILDDGKEETKPDGSC